MEWWEIVLLVVGAVVFVASASIIDINPTTKRKRRRKIVVRAFWAAIAAGVLVWLLTKHIPHWARGDHGYATTWWFKVVCYVVAPLVVAGWIWFFVARHKKKRRAALG